MARVWKLLKPILKRALKAAIDEALSEAGLYQWLASKVLLSPQECQRLARDLKLYVLRMVERW